MTNDTIDHDARVTQAAVVRLPRHAAVRADLDAARMPIMPTLYPGSHSCVAESRCIRHEMTADKPSRPLGAASTTAGPGWRESRLVRPGDGLPRAPRGARNGDDVMNEYEELVRSLVTERFTRWRPPTPISDQREFTEHPLAHMDIPRTSATARVRARIHKDEASTTARSDR